MAKITPTKSQARLFALLIDELEPEIKRAFMASVADLQSGVNWPLLLQELERNNIEGAIAALNISPDAWNTYSATMSNAYARAGASTIAQIQAIGNAPIGVRFQMSNPRAQEWIRRNVAESVVGFTQEAILTARTVIEAGFSAGAGTRTIATDLVGRVQGGIRSGGVLGLDNPRAQRLQAVSQGMRTPEGVQDLVIKHADGSLSIRYKVNKATEKRILSAYNAKTEVPLADRVISEKQYANALLKARGETVANTEVSSAVMSARQEAWQQAVETQGIDPQKIIKTWQHRRGTKDGRPTHIAISGKSVNGLQTPFVLSNGDRLLYPHDPEGGAHNNINCACSCEYRVDRSGGL